MQEIKIRYTWKRKSDGHVWQEISPIECIEGRGDKPYILNHDCFKYWELVARELWTGWTDKTGADIFKGDLISEKGGKQLYEVIWQAHSGQWIMQSQSEGMGYRQMAYDYAQIGYEVVGNRHTSPELLFKSNP